MVTALFTLGLVLSIFVVVFLFLFPLGRGAVYVPSAPEKVRRIADLCAVGRGAVAADLGSGDGRVLVELARRGAEAHGYEINPLLVIISRRAIRRAGLAGRAFTHWQSFWRADLSRFNAVALFQGSFVMRRLERKIRRQMKPGARVVSDFWAFPTLPELSRDGTLYLYRVDGRHDSTAGPSS